jgi:hypothetical protein
LTALINPVLCALDWDVARPKEVKLEYRGGGGDPVDYALFLEREPIPKLLLEAKALGKGLEGWANKIMGYVGAAGVEWVVLTNGNEYRIYNACARLPFDQKLFRKVRLSESPRSETERTRLRQSAGSWKTSCETSSGIANF